MKTKKRKRKSGRFLNGSGKFFLVLALVYLLYFAVSKIVETENTKTYTYAQNQIEVTGNHIISDAKILRICGFLNKDKKQLTIDPARVAEDLMSLHYIKGVSIKDRPPKKLSIHIEERKPVAFVYGRGLNLIDQDGFLMPLPKAGIIWDLPLISGVKESLGKLGETCRATDVYGALRVIKYLEEENPLMLSFISEISLHNPRYFELQLIKGATKIRMSKQTYPKELYILKNYLVDYADWSKLHKIEYIDLRFNNQLVIKYRA